MSFELRTLVVGLAAFAGCGLIGAAIVPLLAWRQAQGAAVARARLLTRLRLLPVAVATVGSAAATTAFLAFESRRPFEAVSGTMVAFALGAAFLLLLSAWRSFRLARLTRQATRAWLSSGEPIALDGVGARTLAVDADFPIVAVVGLFRPRLIIARSVLASCTAEELRAVLAHEQGHLARRDNLRRLAMTAAPDVLGWLPISARLFSAWYDAAEEAADDEAARAHRDGRLHLASALVKVARLATGSPATIVPAAALYSGNPVESRVRRLLAPADGLADRRSYTFGAGVVAAIVAIVFAANAPVVHEWIEAAIRNLP
jgi:Zn-dependent protease with chaperone function